MRASAAARTWGSEARAAWDRPPGAVRRGAGGGASAHGRQGQGHVVSPEPERVREGGLHALRAGLVRYEIEVALRILLVQVDGRWNDAARQDQRGPRRFESAGGVQ